MSKLVLNIKCLLLLYFFTCSQVLQFWAHSRYYKGALTQKRSFLVISTTLRSNFHSTLNSSFDALSKWHEPDMRLWYCWNLTLCLLWVQANFMLKKIRFFNGLFEILVLMITRKVPFFLRWDPWPFCRIISQRFCKKNQKIISTDTRSFFLLFFRQRL